MSELGYEGSCTVGSTAQYVKDVAVNLTASEVDDTTRADQGWMSKRSGLRGWNVTFDMVVKNGDSVYTALKSAFTNATSLTCSVVDKFGNSIAGTVFVTSFTRNEPLDGVVTVSVTLVGNGKPTFS